VQAVRLSVLDLLRRADLLSAVRPSGILTKETLFNTSVQELERPSKLLLLYANQPIEVNSLPTGSIGVLIGLKHTRTGDTLLSNTDNRRLIPGPTRLRGVEIPSAVCSVAIKYSGKEEEKVVGEALERLVRQDPSLRLENPTEEELENNPDAQTLLHGMGPLHLEISLNRLEEEQNVRARSGRVKVSMKESIALGGPAVDIAETWSGTVVGNPAQVEATVKLTVQRLSDAELAVLRAQGEGESLAEWAGNSVVIDVDEEDPLVALVPTIAASLFSCISRGGPLMGLPLSHLRIHLTPVSHFEDLALAPPAAAPSDKGKRPKSAASPSAPSASLLAALPPPAAFARAIAAAMKKALKQGGPTILEPLVDNRISGVDPSDLGRVVADLVSRGGNIGELGEETQFMLGSSGSATDAGDGGEKPYMPPPWISPSASSFLLADSASADRVRKRTISATMPLAELGDYAGKLRSLSGGGGTFETSDAGWGDVDVTTVRKREEAFLGVD
jgi:elongation factor G